MELWIFVVLVVAILLGTIFRSFDAKSVGGSNDLTPMHDPNWSAVRDALQSASQLLRQLTPPVMGTIHVGPSRADPGHCRITLELFTTRDLQPDEKQRTIDQARPIIERRLQKQGYPRAIA